MDPVLTGHYEYTAKKDMILAVAKCVALDAWLWHWKCNALLFEIQEKWTFLL